MVCYRIYQTFGTNHNIVSSSKMTKHPKLVRYKWNHEQFLQQLSISNNSNQLVVKVVIMLKCKLRTISSEITSSVNWSNPQTGDFRMRWYFEFWPSYKTFTFNLWNYSILKNKYYTEIRHVRLYTMRFRSKITKLSLIETHK